jgi:excisionase family DNA binding protein
MQSWFTSLLSQAANNMSPLIDFAQYKRPTEISAKRSSPVSSGAVPQPIDISDDEYKLTVNILVHNYPLKISFTLEEVASQLGVNKEFIRRRIKSGLIKATYYGDKPTIHISELARLLIQGVK